MSFLKSIKKALKVVAPIAGGVLGRTFGGSAGAAIGSGLGALAAGQDPKRALLGAGLGYGLSALTGDSVPKNKPSEVIIEDRSFQSPGTTTGTSAGIGQALKDVDFVKAAGDLVPETTQQSGGLADIKNWFRDTDGSVNWAKTGAAGLGALTLLDPGPQQVGPQFDPNQPLNQSLPSNLNFGADQLRNYNQPVPTIERQGPATGYTFSRRNPLAEARDVYTSIRG